ncbi:monocarboxylate transporter 6-like, partial [Argonauta hians]
SLSRSIASMVVSVPWGVAFGSGILTGLLINHYPCGLIIAFGSVMMSGGIIASSFASNVIFLVVCLGIFSGIGASFIFISSFIGTGLYFGQRGSYAIAIVSVAVPLGFLLYPLLAGVLISEFTWRGALLIFGGMSLNSVPFGLLIWRAELHQNMEEVVAVDVKSNIGSILTINKNDFTFKLCKEILANKKFWVFLMATSMLFSLITIIFNQITDFCIEIGYESVAGTALTIFNIPAFFGRLGSSLLLRFTRITPSLLFALSVTLFGLTMSLLPLVHNFDTTLAVIATAGLLQGPSSGIYTCVVIEVIGIQRAAPAQGMTDTFYGILTIITGYFAGLISEVTKSYKNGFILFSVLCTVSGLAHLVYIGVEWYQDRNRPYQPTFQDSNCKPVAV